MPHSEEISQLLKALASGDQDARAKVLPLVYEELRKLAGHMFARERADHTLQPTALVHEAWIKLARETQAEYQNRRHFLAVAASAMRRLLIDHARGRNRDKRGGGWEAVTFDEDLAFEEMPIIDALALEAALSALDPRLAQVAALRVLGGMEVSEIAEELGVSARTVKRDWRRAREALEAALRPDPQHLLVVTIGGTSSVHESGYEIDGTGVRLEIVGDNIRVVEAGNTREEMSPLTLEVGDLRVIVEVYLGFG